MAQPAITVDNLGKCYRIYHAAERPATAAEAVKRAAASPFKYLSDRLRRPDESELFWALRDVSFEVQQGEVLGIIGKNGAGKSTLLKILSRITDPTTGRAVIRGRVNSLLEVGTGFHPELNGRENIYMSAALYGMKRAEINAKLDEIIDFSGVEKFIDTPVKRYSSGMYVRLAFAVAAHIEPDVLIVDEVLAVGDIDFQKKCLGKMENISGEGRTVLVVSHQMPVVMNLCRKAMLLKEGRIAHYGETAGIVQQYLASGKEQVGEVVWEDTATAPGNEVARLKAVRILQEGVEGPTADVDISREVVLEIEYCCLKDGAPLYVAFLLENSMGVNVLCGGNNPSVNLTPDKWWGKPHPRGIYRARGIISAGILNDIGYVITPAVGLLPNDTIAIEKNALGFTGHDTGAMRNTYYGSWFGVIRSKLSWQVESLG